MNEEINEAVETEGAEGWADSDAFWDDDPAAETEPAAEQEEAEDAEADEQEAEETDTADDPHDEGADDGAEEPEGPQGESADQRFELKHLEETRSVDREEVIKLAQKGMDYDRIREERDSIRPELRLYREFLKELADGSGLTVSELIDTVRAQRLVAKEKENGKEMTEAEALIKVQRERSEKAKSAPKADIQGGAGRRGKRALPHLQRARQHGDYAGAARRVCVYAGHVPRRRLHRRRLRRRGNRPREGRRENQACGARLGAVG